VAKSKYSPALFEVMNRQKDTGKLGVPKWWKPGSTAQQAGAQDPAGAAESQAPAAHAVAEPADASVALEARPPKPAPSFSIARPDTDSDADATAAGAPSYGSDRLPVVSLESGRLFLVLKPAHVAIACGALLILLVGTYQLGRGMSDGTASAGTDMTLLDQKPNRAVLENPGARSDSPPSRAGSAGRPATGGTETAEAVAPQLGDQELKVGFTYVVLDTYPPEALKTAEFVQKWLASTHNIGTVLRERRGKFWLIGTEPFDYSAPGGREKGDRYIQRIKDLGAECRRELIRAKLDVYGFAAPMPIELTK